MENKMNTIHSKLLNTCVWIQIPSDTFDVDATFIVDEEYYSSIATHLKNLAWAIPSSTPLGQSTQHSVGYWSCLLGCMLQVTGSPSAINHLCKMADWQGTAGALKVTNNNHAIVFVDDKLLIRVITSPGAYDVVWNSGTLQFHIQLEKYNMSSVLSYY